MLHVSDVVNKDGKTKTKTKTKYSRQNWGTWTIVPHVSAMSSTKMATFPRASPTSTMLATWEQIFQIFEYNSDISIFFRYFNMFQLHVYQKYKKFLILPHWPFSSPCEWGRSQCWVCNCFVISTAAYLAIWFLFWKYLIISVTGWTGGENIQNNCLPIWIMCN